MLTLTPPAVRAHVPCREFLVTNVPAGASVLDVGCGDGDLMHDLASRGCTMTGVEIVPELVSQCRADGLNVVSGFAEELPFEDASFDGLVSSVVLPYTADGRAIVEFARVIKPGGFIRFTTHGLGYGFDYLLMPRGKRSYGLRMLLNTLLFRVTGRKFPGEAGDTICQSQRKLAQFRRAAGLRLTEEVVIERCLGLPRFLCQALTK